ncbi:P-loop containing nucleoside triphosphate hydrolase protein [Crepidotus variabilis]|uniref:RNA helicase n=1 Tax=Crepidotus variabilis TaxID=179855 RepID=A0A9P6EJT7_9AGAR|nr:P-loop containing nucleoside triphosphate hydrolase protein [Crepidotus variabilis]
MITTNFLKGIAKRKATTKPFVSRKKLKAGHFTADNLPWKSVSRPKQTGLDGDDGILELEEVEGVEVLYEETTAGRVVKFNFVGEVQQGEKRSDSPKPDALGREIPEEPFTFDGENLLPHWNKWDLHPKILKALHHRRFLEPTPIQSAALPASLEGRDVVGVAQTGSGKTLAYGLPVLHHLLNLPRASASTKRSLCALILAPTRELALQVSSHLNSIITSIEYKAENDALDEPGASTSQNPGNTTPKRPPYVSIAAVVGGMSAQKQRRLLDRGVDVLVATPGRLWDLLQNDDNLANEIRNLRFLILDEADRMIEAGHFAELENILRLTLRESRIEIISEEHNVDLSESEANEYATQKPPRDTMQTFVYSATLSKNLQQNLKKRSRPKGNKKHYKRNEKLASTLDDLLLRLDFRDPKPEVIDLSPVGGVVSTLQESKIDCPVGDKDVYLYYFLLRHSGRSLVFLSSIDGIRRLMPLVDLLNIKAFPLHSQMEQRQRLKNLDRFKSTPNSVLLATDIAARGLDIPAVDHVIHFQIPRTADTYIHRNGRTARAMRKGFSMLMIAPEERRVVKALMGNLGRNEDEIAEMSIELSMLDKLKARIQLAKKIENALHKVKKSNHDRKWMKDAAETLGVDLDSEFEIDSQDEDKPSTRIYKGRSQKMAAMKEELRLLLSQPLVARGVSTKYITSGSRPIVDDLLAGQLNENMLGLKKTEAGNELTAKRKARKTN